MNRNSFLIALGAAAALPAAARAASAPEHRLTGIIMAISGSTALVRTRGGSAVKVDLSEAAAQGHRGVIAPGVSLTVYGAYAANGTFHAVRTGHAASAAQSWAPDR